MVYPHLRGAAILASGACPVGSGISPPAWGSHTNLIKVHRVERYIPTCVGQPVAGRTFESSYEVYPHLRGAARHPDPLLRTWRGISPPAWGSLADAR